MKKHVLSALFSALFLLTSALPFSGLAQTTVDVTFWHSMSEEAGEALSRIVERYNETTGAEEGIHVTLVYQGKYVDSVTKMNSMLNSGDTEHLPDVMQLDATGKIVYGAADAAYTVDELLQEAPDTDLSDYLPSALQNWNVDGVQLGVPFATSTTLTYYNKTVLDGLGIPAPETLQEIGRIAAFPLEEDATVYACIPNTPSLANWLGQLGSYLVDCENGSAGMAERLDCIQNGALETFLQVWKDLYDTGALANREASTDEFAAGKLLIMTASSSTIASLENKIGGRFELGVCAYPKVNEASSSGATVSGSCLVMFDHGQEKREAAWKVIRFLTGPEAQAEFAMKAGYIPAVGSALQTDTWRSFILQHPQYAAGAEQLALTPVMMRSVTVGPSADFYYSIMNDVSEMLDQDLSASETAQMMEEDLTGMLEQFARNNR